MSASSLTFSCIPCLCGQVLSCIRDQRFSHRSVQVRCCRTHRGGVRAASALSGSGPQDWFKGRSIQCKAAIPSGVTSEPRCSSLPAHRSFSERILPRDLPGLPSYEVNFAI